jgi:hypothetical protein
VVLPFTIVLAAGAAGHMRLVGRHLTPLLPYLLAFMAVGLAQLLGVSEIGKKLLAYAAVSLLLFSSLEIRLAPRHRRDDYRTAAAIAQQAIKSGQRIWWLADVSTGLYYLVSLGTPAVTTWPDLTWPIVTPDLVVLSKPDIYDSSGDERAYLARNDFKVMTTLPAFEIYVRSPAQVPAPWKSLGKSDE